MSEIVYLNGRFVPHEEALVSVEDRGFVFADGIYEVVKFYSGRPFRMDEHMRRLQASTQAIDLPLPMTLDEFARAMEETVVRNGLAEVDAAVYLQVTRGPAPRAHAFPANPRPTVFVMARRDHGYSDEFRMKGVRAITVEDRRWRLCHVKSVGLLLNTLAKQQAVAAGCYEGIFVRDGIVTEGTASNLLTVTNGRIQTHPEGPYILSGVTRQAVLESADAAGIPVDYSGLGTGELYRCDEVFLTGTITEVMPVVEVDGRRIGAGTPGPITLRLFETFRALSASPARA